MSHFLIVTCKIDNNDPLLSLQDSSISRQDEHSIRYLIIEHFLNQFIETI